MPDAPHRVLVTGGAGFIGSHIVDRLLGEGFTVGVLDSMITGSHDNLKAAGKGVSFHDVDIRDASSIEKVVSGYDSIVHEAALVSVTRSVEDPLTTNAVNVDGTVNLLRAAVHAKAKKFVYASSSSVYGDSATLPKTEDMVTRPISPYGVSKLSAELYCAAFARVYGIQTVALRYFNVFGPRQRPGPYGGVIPAVIKKALSGDRPVIYGDGEQSRDFTYVEDVAEANLQALKHDLPAGSVFNIGGGEPHSINELVAKVLEAVGRTDLEPQHLPPRMGDIRDSFADISRAASQLGYRPKFGFEEGLRQTVAWFRSGETT